MNVACALVSFSLSLFLYPFLLLSSIFIDLYIICLSSSFIVLPPYFSPSASVIPLLPFSPFSSSPLHSLLFLLHHLFFRSIPMLFFVPPSLPPSFHLFFLPSIFVFHCSVALSTFFSSFASSTSPLPHFIATFSSFVLHSFLSSFLFFSSIPILCLNTVYMFFIVL